MNIQNLLDTCLAKPNETIRKHTENVKLKAVELKNLDYISDKTFDLLTIASEYHDYGKLNKEFQKRIITKNSKFNSEKEVGHNILSTYFLNKELFQDVNDYRKVFYSILNHHFYIDNLKALEDEKELSHELLKEFDIQKISLKDIKYLKNNIDEEFDILTGLLNKCDYSASGNYPIEYKNDFLIKSLEKLNYSWNNLQNYCIENKNEDIIVIANTGMGKTEAGLLWIGNNKGFFILPLRTAINSIYKRVRDDLIQSEFEKKVVLLHSEAMDFLLNNTEDSFNNIKEYLNEGRALSIPLTISTLDQLFNFVFMYPGHELKLATLSYSKIVLDEIQAYSPDLLAYIVIGLKKVKKVGGKFAILTATLPPFIKDCIEEEVGLIKYKTFLEGVDRHNLKVINSEISADTIYNHYSCTGGKVLVVCNTIKKAQELYKNLEFLGLTSNEIELLHSKFLKKDRLEKEKDIINFGRTDILGKKIWISTSLVEASLDIDFDYLFTELNDLSGLFQRLGRVNRKGLKSIKDTNAFVFTQINKNLFINGKRGFIDKDIFSLSKEALSNIDGILSEEKKYELIEKYLTTENLKNSSFIENFRLNKNYMNNVWRGKFDKDEVAKEFRNIISYKCMPKCIYNDNSVLIDELIQIIESESGEAKEKAKSELSMYTISLGLMDKNKDAQFKQIGKEKIYFVNGSYSYELGFEKGKDEQIVYDIFL